MRARHRLILAMTLVAAALLAPAAHANAQACSPDAVQQALLDAGQLTQEAIDEGVAVSLVRCGDTPAEGVSDPLSTLASGGPAGDPRFGVPQGNGDGSLGARILSRQA